MRKIDLHSEANSCEIPEFKWKEGRRKEGKERMKEKREGRREDRQFDSTVGTVWKTNK